jgi:1-acyl-sn-glycerol-3-phosphate acyltransferase
MRNARRGADEIEKVGAPEGESVGASPTVKVGIRFGLALGTVALASFVLFRLVNRVQAEGLENIPAGSENVLYCLNHNSLLDNFAFESVAYMPKVLFQPEYLPVNLADRENFFGDPSSRKLKDRVLTLLSKHLFSHLRTYPVDRKRGGLEQVDQWAELLKQNIVVVFPEGTRSRNGEIGTGKAGVGKLIYQARPTVIPVRMMGMENVLGVGRLVPNVFQTVRIVIGKPLDLGEYLERPLPAEWDEQIALYRQIAGRVVGAIKSLTPSER